MRNEVNEPPRATATMEAVIASQLKIGDLQAYLDKLRGEGERACQRADKMRALAIAGWALAFAESLLLLFW